MARVADMCTRFLELAGWSDLATVNATCQFVFESSNLFKARYRRPSAYGLPIQNIYRLQMLTTGLTCNRILKL